MKRYLLPLIGALAVILAAPTVALAGSPPSNTSLPVLSGSPVQGDTLTTSNGTWSGSPTSYSYKWWDCKPGTCNQVGSGSSHTLASADVGWNIHSQVFACNAFGCGNVGSAAELVQPGPDGPPLGNWKPMAFDDEFSNDTSLSPSWTNLGWGTHCFTSITNNAPVIGGNALEFDLESATIGNGCNLENTFSFTYGAAEAEVYGAATSTGGPADHSGWWIRGASAADGEIDLYENSKCFIHNASGGNATSGTPAGQWAGQWHTYTVDWESTGVVTIYWDGVQVCQASNLGWSGNPINPRLNLYTDSNIPLYAPTQTYVRYVRIWQH